VGIAAPRSTTPAVMANAESQRGRPARREQGAEDRFAVRRLGWKLDARSQQRRLPEVSLVLPDFYLQSLHEMRRPEATLNVDSPQGWKAGRRDSEDSLSTADGSLSASLLSVTDSCHSESGVSLLSVNDICHSEFLSEDTCDALQEDTFNLAIAQFMDKPRRPPGPLRILSAHCAAPVGDKLKDASRQVAPKEQTGPLCATWNVIRSVFV